MTSNKFGYGECNRCGDRVKLSRMVKDGQMRGLLVCPDCYDPRHPQDVPLALKAERHEIPAPELSKPDGEGTEAPALVFDSLGKLL